MARGRKPTSSAVLRAKGSFQNHPERENRFEPVPVKGRPAVPLSVSSDPVALKYWNTACELLEGMGLMATADGSLIEQLAVAYSCFLRSWQDVQEHGLLSRGVDKCGNEVTIRNAAALEMHKAMERIGKLLPELGLTPSSRTRLKADPAQVEKDMFGEWLERGGLN